MLNPKTKPWNLKADEAPKEIYDPIGMVGPEERRAYYWLGKNWLSGRGCIVDAGAFLGASTYCFAAGAANSGREATEGAPLVHAYDYFKVVDKYVGEAISRDFRPITEGESYLDIFEKQTALYTEIIETHPGDFLMQKWAGGAVEILFIDIAKTTELHSHVIGEFFPSLIPGHSMVVHQDYFHCWHPYIHIGMQYLKEEFELIDEHVPHQTRIWRLAKPIPGAKLERLRNYDLSREERLNCLDSLIESSSDFYRPMIEVVKIWQHCLDKKWLEAASDIRAFESRYDVSNESILWAVQLREVKKVVYGNLKGFLNIKAGD